MLGFCIPSSQHLVILSCRGIENGQANEGIVPIVEENAVVGHFAVGGGGLLFKVDVEDGDFAVVVEISSFPICVIIA